MKKAINELIKMYSDMWVESRNALDKARQNTSIKINREIMLRETTRKDCYSDIINHLISLRNSTPTK